MSAVPVPVLANADDVDGYRIVVTAPEAEVSKVKSDTSASLCVNTVDMETGDQSQCWCSGTQREHKVNMKSHECHFPPCV